MTPCEHIIERAEGRKLYNFFSGGNGEGYFVCLIDRCGCKDQIGWMVKPNEKERELIAYRNKINLIP